MIEGIWAQFAEQDIGYSDRILGHVTQRPEP